MSDSWKNILKSYLHIDADKPKNSEDANAKKENTSSSFFSAYLQKSENNNEETAQDPNMISHIVVDEQYEKYVEEHIVDEPEQIIETEVDAYEAAIADGGRPIELQETQETHLVDGPTPRPVEEPDFTQEELEAFKELNADKFIHETNDVPVPEIVDHYDVPNEVPVTDEPIETKVKKVKVTKPKAPKKAGRPKTKK